MGSSRSPARAFVLLCLGLSCLYACSGGSSSGPVPLAQAGISRLAGGTIEVTTGALAGLKLTIPPDALASDALISVHPGVTTEAAGLLVLSEAALFLPGGTRFDPVASLTMPFDPGLLPARTSSADLLVMLRDEVTGQIEELTPNTVDELAGRVEVDLPHLSTCWVAVQLPPIDLVSYLPFNIGDEYVLRGDVSNLLLTLRIEAAPLNANFPAPDILTMAFEFAGIHSGYYVRAAANGDLLLLGQFAEDGQNSFEEVHDQITVLAPGVVEDGEIFHTEATYTGHLPIGNPAVAYTGRIAADTEVFTASEIFVTPVGDFPDPVIFIREEDWMDSDGFAGTALTAFALAEGLGVIALEIDDVETFFLIDGTVGGQPILVSGGRAR